VSLTWRVLAGLVAGFVLGLALAYLPSKTSIATISVADTIGTLFINLIRMTVIPLVVSMLIASVGSVAASRALARAGGRAALLAVGLLTAAALVTVAIAQPVLSQVRIDAASARALGGNTAELRAAGTRPSSLTPAVSRGPGQWLIDLVPQNPIKAAADGAMLPVIIFAVLFALALARVEEARRGPVLRVVDGIAGAMQTLVGAILQLAPIGVFALAIPLASKLGLAAAGAVAAYVVLVVVLTVFVAIVLLYPVGILMGSMSAREFVDFCAPPQAVAFASRTSLAALPVMVESAERAKLPQVVSRVIVPLGASIFRLGAAVAQPVGVLFLARLYGVVLGPGELASIVFTVVLTSFAVPGIPFGTIIAMVPVLSAANVPVEGIGILLAVDTIPDMFRTTENVTGTMALAAALARTTRSP
jgi:proton glutamate symport protein